MVKKIGIGFVAVLAALSLLVATRPAAFHIERSTTIAAPPEVVFALVNDLHEWPRWSPYEKRDPGMKREYAGAAAGEGASYRWDGNDDVGAGLITVTRSVPGQLVALRLDFSRPFVASNEVEFSFQGSGDQTRVVWGMDGRNGFVGKLLSLLFDVDAMVGKDFEAGLAAMKAAAEAASREAPGRPS
jgi:uncharacterized protein YndB with AHSA1/START domain